MALDGSSGTIDPVEIGRTIDSADVFCMRFPLFRKTLVVDTRSDAVDPPLIRLVATAKSIEDRFRSLRKMRPRFPQPEKIALIQWPSYVESLVRLGVWDRLLQRFARDGNLQALAACKDALQQLRDAERSELISAITGKNYHTIWQRAPH